MRNTDRLVTRSMLLESVWAYSFSPTTNIVESNMSRLRTALLGLGCDPIVFTGADLAYTDGLLYCRNTTYEPEWRHLKTNEERAADLLGQGCVEMSRAHICRAKAELGVV